MKIKDLKKEDLDTISYDDLAYLILLESNKKLKINELFKEVCRILNLSDDIFETRIADFFELLSTDKKFIMVEDGYWDLREKHTQKIKIETEDDDLLTDSIEKLEDDDLNENDDSEDIFYEADETEDEVENDLKDLVLIDDDDEETNGLM